MISDRISDDIPPQMKNLNIVIPILMYFLTINIEKIWVSDGISQNIPSQGFDVIQSDFALHSQVH